MARWVWIVAVVFAVLLLLGVATVGCWRIVRALFASVWDANKTFLVKLELWIILSVVFPAFLIVLGFAWQHRLDPSTSLHPYLVNFVSSGGLANAAVGLSATSLGEVLFTHIGQQPLTRRAAYVYRILPLAMVNLICVTAAVLGSAEIARVYQELRTHGAVGLDSADMLRRLVIFSAVLYAAAFFQGVISLFLTERIIANR